MKKIGVLTSGGDAPGMNAAIRAVVRTAVYKDMEVYGIRRGFDGLVNAEIDRMDVKSVGEILHRGGTILNTARSEAFKTEEGLKKAANVLEIFGIQGLVVIGGDGSFHGAMDLSERGISVIGIPGTIDNDISCTDFTIGFDTAVNTVLDAISKIRDTVSSHERTNIVEVMGRHVGDIAIYTGIAGGAEGILIPEKPMDIDQLCRRIIEGRHRGKNSSIIILAEGVGKAFEMEKVIEEKTGMETRATVLGYIQRGGSPSAADIILASRMGHYAVELLEKDVGNRVISTRGNQIVDDDIKDALAMTRPFNKELYDLAQILSI
ncbi:6-phosphofructokinase [Eubacteriales bacterium mix99]|jgi:6-phosphofructokinase 1|nr:6-phosphofructokinase [Clostridiales bacterium]